MPLGLIEIPKIDFKKEFMYLWGCFESFIKHKYLVCKDKEINSKELKTLRIHNAIDSLIKKEIYTKIFYYFEKSLENEGREEFLFRDYINQLIEKAESLTVYYTTENKKECEKFSIIATSKELFQKAREIEKKELEELQDPQDLIEQDDEHLVLNDKIYKNTSLELYEYIIRELYKIRNKLTHDGYKSDEDEDLNSQSRVGYFILEMMIIFLKNAESNSTP